MKTKTTKIILFIGIFSLFSLLLIFASGSRSKVFADGTCCLPNATGGASGTCDYCSSGETKNYGDSCGGAPNCRVCGSTYSRANLCGGPPPPPSCTPSCGSCSAACGGGTQSCTRSDCSTYSQSCCSLCSPGAVTITSPADGSTLPINSTNVTWTWPVSSGWGAGCPNSPGFAVYVNTIPTVTTPCPSTGWTLLANLPTTSTNFTLSNLNWGQAYCIRVVRYNNSATPTSSTTRVRVNSTPVLTSSWATDSCNGLLNNGTTGLKRFQGVTAVSNPLTFNTQFVDQEGDPFRVLWYALVPANFGSYTENRDTVSLLEILQKANAARAIAFRHNVTNGDVTLWRADATQSAPQTSGNLMNDYGTVQIMNIGTDTSYSVTGNVVNSRIMLELEDTLAAGTYNIYASVATLNPDGTVVSAYATATNPYMFKKVGTWSFDKTLPNVSISDAYYTTSTTFRMTWNASEPPRLLKSLNTYVNATMAPSQLRDNNAYVLNFPTTSASVTTGIGITSFTNTAPSTWVASRVYTDITTSPLPGVGYNFKLSAVDSACNLLEQSKLAEPAAPWIVGYQNSISANSGIKNFKIPDLSSFTLPFTTDSNSLFLTTYSALSGTSELVLPTIRRSRANEFATAYINNATKPPLGSGYTSWLDYFLNITKNAPWSVVSDSRASVTIGGNFSGTIATQKIYIYSGNLIISSGSNCNIDAIFFVNGTLTINPDLNKPSSSACLFIVKGNVLITNGGTKAAVLMSSLTAQPQYDIVNAMIVTDGTIQISRDCPYSTSYKCEGLYLKGSVIANQTTLQRNLYLNANQYHPAIIFSFDPIYKEKLKDILKVTKYSIREILE